MPMPAAPTSARPDASARVRRLAASAATAVAVALAGCAQWPTPIVAPAPADLGRVAIVAADQAPEVDLQGLVHGKGEGAALVGGVTFGTCIAGLGVSGCAGPLCGPMAGFMVALCGVLAVGGGVAGAVTAEPAARVHEHESRMTAQLEARAMQQSLRDAVAAIAERRRVDLAEVDAAAAHDTARARDYRPLAARGVDTVVETALTRVGTVGGSFGQPAQAVMRAQVRRVRTADNHELGHTRFVWEGPRLTLAEWAADDAQPLARAVHAGFEALGLDLADTSFAAYALPSRQVQVSGLLTPSFGLAAIDPPTRTLPLDSPLLPDRIEWVRVASLQPRLTWQAFPRADDVAAAPDAMARVRDVRYDLVVARERHGAPAEIVLRREGLPAPAFDVDVALAPKARYYWSVRARFELDGRERVTEWSRLGSPTAEVVSAPSWMSYRFATPPQGPGD